MWLLPLCWRFYVFLFDALFQITTLPDQFPDAHAAMNKLRLEYVVSVEGLVRSRPGDSVNKKMKTGSIEVFLWFPWRVVCWRLSLQRAFVVSRKLGAWKELLPGALRHSFKQRLDTLIPVHVRDINALLGGNAESAKHFVHDRVHSYELSDSKLNVVMIVRSNLF